MSPSSQKILCATVSALALTTALAPAAQAAPLGGMMFGSSDQSAYARAAALSHKKIALLIESASPAHLDSAESVLTAAGPNQTLLYSKSVHYQKYATQCQKEINPNNTITAVQVTETLRQNFLDCARKKEIIGVASALPQSQNFSLNSDYLAQCQSEYGVKPGESLTQKFNQAQQVYNCIPTKQSVVDNCLLGFVGISGLLMFGAALYQGIKTDKKPKTPHIK